MTTERSDKVYENWRAATEKFDYFVLGLTGALCAYISQTFHPARIGFDPGTLELVSLIVLALSAVAGFRRIELTIGLNRINHQLLRAKEERGALSVAGPGPVINESTGDIYSPHQVRAHIQAKSEEIPALAARVEFLGKRADAAYRVRNRLIFMGFCSLLFAKVWSAYVAT